MGVNYVVPVSNFVLDYPIKVNDSIIIPPIGLFFENCEKEIISASEQNRIIYEDGDTGRCLIKQDYNREYMSTITQSEYDLCIEIAKKLIDTSDDILNTSYITFCANGSYPSTFSESFFLCDYISDLADKDLDYFRISYGNYSNKEKLPGLAGYDKSSGIKTVYQFSKSQNGEIYWNTILGRVSYFPVEGIGLYIDGFDINDYSQHCYQILYDRYRNDEVYKICRYALQRVAKSYYIPDSTNTFIFLWTTLEAIASPEYENVKKWKGKVISYIVQDQTNYNKLGEYIKKISKDVRTELVHNGKLIQDLNDYSTTSAIDKELTKIKNIIIDYVIAVYTTGIKSFTDLDNHRKELQNKLGVN